MRIALFTDQGAHYRKPAFAAIEQSTREGCEIYFYVPVSGAPGYNIDDGNFGLNKVYRIKNLYFWKAKAYFFQIEAIKAAITSKYDTIVLWGAVNIFSNFFAAFFAKALGKKVVFWGHGAYGNEGRIKAACRKLLYFWADSHLLYGYHGKAIVDSWFPDKKSDVIFN